MRTPKAILGVFVCLAGTALGQTPTQVLPPLRPPAVPLVACDPYFSVWSFADRLTYEDTKHWTGARQAMHSMIRVDGAPYRLMGWDPRDVEALPQVGVQVLPTRTLYHFEGAGVHVTVTFMTPMLPYDLELVGRPFTYVIWDVRAVDGKQHAISLYFDHTGELVVNTPDQPVTWSQEEIGELAAQRMGSQDQPVLAKKGDDLRIDWGYLYTAAPNGTGVNRTVGPGRAVLWTFARSGSLPERKNFAPPRAAKDRWPAAALTFDVGKVGGKGTSRYLILAYDDLYSIEYLGERLRPYWRRKGAEAADLLRDAAREYESLKAQCQAFDKELMDDLTRVGGLKYARLAALAYRQSLAAHKLVADGKGRPFYFPKENFSNGCIGTVDVFYPSAPIFLYLNPDLLKASVVPILDYAAMDRWRFPFAPHDLGTYPLANGQVYGGGEKTEENQMPVEESGNMLLLMAAISRVEGNVDFSRQHWPLLAKWAQYLKEKGLDPENQLCTDDFAGHLAHNANLSLKAILALRAYAQLAEMIGNKEEAAEYRTTAEGFARQWIKMADDGDHYRLAFDKPGTWSQKYNLLWDGILGLNLFPNDVVQKELAFYLRTQNRFGLPLDSRKAYTKLDWIVWTATLAETRQQFRALVEPAYDFAHHSPTRVPLSDWYWTNDAAQVGFQARSVVGGVFAKMLTDSRSWKKWVGKAKANSQAR
jgi:hypothetical protein